MTTQKTIEKIIKSYKAPYLETDLITAKAVKQITADDQVIRIVIELGFPAEQIAAVIIKELKEQIATNTNVANIDIQITWKIASHRVQQNVQATPKIKNIIGIASGKGGVGKSTTAVNLALALRQQGAKIGLLDADIHGPNQPQMLGVKARAEVTKDKKIKPIEKFGISSISIGYLLDKDQPVVWRGPMVSGALLQLLNDTDWPELDYLIMDLPPGTGDVQLTLAQKIPVAGTVIVTTPQEIALSDARKAVMMFKKVNVNVLGVVENMSYFQCPHCSERTAIFGEKGGENMAEQFNVPFLGALPLDQQIREQADCGEPIVIAEPDGLLAQYYRDIALRLSAILSLQPKNYAAKFGKITVE